MQFSQQWSAPSESSWGAAHFATCWESKWKGLRIAPLKLARWHRFKNMVGTQAEKGGGTFPALRNLWLSSQEGPFNGNTCAVFGVLELNNQNLYDFQIMRFSN